MKRKLYYVGMGVIAVILTVLAIVVYVQISRKFGLEKLKNRVTNEVESMRADKQYLDMLDETLALVQKQNGEIHAFNTERGPDLYKGIIETLDKKRYYAVYVQHHGNEYCYNYLVLFDRNGILLIGEYHICGSLNNLMKCNDGKALLEYLRR